MKFFISSDVVRNIGIIFLYKQVNILNSYLNTNIKIDLQKNYLKIENLNIRLLRDYILFVLSCDGGKNFGLICGEKNYKQNIKRIRNYPNDHIEYKIKMQDIESKNKKEKINEKGERDNLDKKFFPYLRNSAKYGDNSKIPGDKFKKRVYYQSLLELLKIVFYKDDKNNEDEKNRFNEKYEFEEDNCTICNLNKTPKYDINFKDKSKKTRTVSKYNYTFMGAENSSYNFYCKANEKVCFECEFLNLMFLLYVYRYKPSYILHTNDLKSLYSLNEYLLKNKFSRNTKALSLIVNRETSERVSMYNVHIDSNKGVILDIVTILEKTKLAKQLDMSNIVNSFNLDKEKKDVKKYWLKEISFNNFIMVRKELLRNLIVKGEDFYTSENIKYYLRFLLLEKGDLDMKVNTETINEMRITGENIAVEIRKFYGENEKEDRADKIIEKMKYDISNILSFERVKDLIPYITKLITSYKQKFPKEFISTINSEDLLEINIIMGSFMEGLSTKKSMNMK